jgi:D-arabinonate dehydratase
MPHGYCVEGFPRPERDPVWHRLFSERPELDKGVLRLTDKPGLGIEIDRKIVEKWRI